MHSSDGIPTLVSTPSPIEGESLLGYLLRVSEANGYSSPTWITSLCGIPYDQFYRKSQDLTKLGKILGQSASDLEKLPWLYFPQDRLFDGEPIKVPAAYKALAINKPKVCPACIEEDGITHSAWDLAWFHVCPKHKTALLTHCPSCGESISWCRPGLNVCQCGVPFPHSTQRCTNTSVINLMQLVDDLVRAREISSNPSTGQPMEELYQYRLTGLMALFDRVSKVIEETRTERVVRRIDRSPEMLQEVAKFFTDWPNNFHGLLKEMQSKAKSRPESIVVPLPVALEKVLGQGWQSSRFARRSDFLAGTGLLSGGAYFFSPSEGRTGKGGELKTETGEDGAEYASISNLATHLDVHKATIKSWAKAGVHGLSFGDEGTPNNRKMVKLNPDFPKKTSSRCLTPRLAGKYIGIPESILTRLRQDGYYESKYFSRFPGDFQAEDLDLLAAKFIRKAPEVLSLIPMAAVTLDEIRAMSFGGAEIKYRIYQAILEGELKPMGRISKNVRGIAINSLELDQFVETESLKLLGSLPAYKVAKLLGCSLEVVDGLVESGHLRGFKRQRSLQVFVKSLEEFRGTYVSCASWARQLKTSARALVNRYEYKLPMIKIEDKRRGSVSHFCRRSEIRSRLLEQKFRILEGQAGFGFPEDLPISMSKRGERQSL